MSRKVPSFDQLITYMDLGASGRENNIYYNLYSRKPDEIEAEFTQNSRLLIKRKNGVFMYHEVISITRSDKLSEKEQIEILRQTVYKYIQSRAPENLVYAVLHDDKADNLHYHLLISSNKCDSSDKHRLSKAEFSTVKKNLEIFILEQHPELDQKKLISRERNDLDSDDKVTLSNKEVELKKRTGKTPDKDRVRENLERIFASAKTREQFLELLESENLAIYKRGKHWGVLDEKTNRKHRFKTLGVDNAFERLDKQLTKLDSKSQQNPNKDNLVDRVAKQKNTETKQTTHQVKVDESEPTAENQKQAQKAKAKSEKVQKQQQQKPKDKESSTLDSEAEKRKAEMEKLRENKAQQKQNQQKKQ